MMQAGIIDDFLNAHGWGAAVRMPLGADFSTRHFMRLERQGTKTDRAILMIATPEQKTAEFVAVAGVLRLMELSAPEIYGADIAQGLTLMEDLGGRNIGSLLDAGQDALSYYQRAATFLAVLHQRFKPELQPALPLPVFSPALFAEQAGLFLEYYLPFKQNRAVDATEKNSFMAAWLMALKVIDALPQTLMLRDFMPDNLLDMPQRDGVRDVGVVDFQDGGTGPMAYDFASLCEVVRRDGGDAMLEPVLAHYHALNPVMPLVELGRACHILAAQRHMRILGIIARLGQKPEQRGKLAYLPRIEAYLKILLRDDALHPVRRWCDERNLLS